MELKVNDPKLIEAMFKGDAPDIYFAPDVDTLIAEKDALIAELKAKLVDAGMRERKLKRALYKACANWAHHRVFVRFKTNEKAWENMERKCRAKAEEYK